MKTNQSERVDPFAVSKPISPRPVEVILAPAKIRWKIKGADDGPLYRGGQLIVPCAGCGKSPSVKPLTTDL